MPLTASTVKALRGKIDSYTEKPNGIPGIVSVVVDRTGQPIFSHASGKRGKDVAKDMDFETVFWIASCTKLVTTIAAMQMVEQGLIDLDSEDDIVKYLPELSQIKVLVEREDGHLVLEAQKRRITLRMLLTHTAGFSYSFLSTKLKRWYEPIGMDELDNRAREIFTQPLVNQPGTTWTYGINLDWVGHLIERIAGKSLGEHFQESIFEPLGIVSMSFIPDKNMKANLAHAHRRYPDGSIELLEHGQPLRDPLTASTPDEVNSVYQCGGGGLFAQPAEYCKILAMLLNDGVDPVSSARILKKGTVDEMFSNQIPHLPDFARNSQPPSKPSLINAASETYPQDGNPPQGWGLSFFLLLHPCPTSRAAGTAWWSGMTNLVWWVDRVTGVAGIIASQILPFGDAEVFRCQSEIENAVYEDLRGI